MKTENLKVYKVSGFLVSEKQIDCILARRYNHQKTNQQTKTVFSRQLLYNSRFMFECSSRGKYENDGHPTNLAPGLGIPQWPLAFTGKDIELWMLVLTLSVSF